MSTEATFANRVRVLRREMGLDQAAFAKLLHISRTYLSNIEGGRQPSSALAAFFDLLERDFHARQDPEISVHSSQLPVRGSEFPVHGSEFAVQSSQFPVHGSEFPVNREPRTENREPAPETREPKVQNRELSTADRPPPTAHREPANTLSQGGRARLRRAREAAGHSVKEFARLMGYSISIYQDIEQGRASMGEKMARKAAKLLHISADDLLDGADEPPARNGLHGTFGAMPEIEMPPGMRGKYVPLLSLAQCGPSVCWDDGAYTGEGFFAVDPKDSKAFAVVLAGDSMQPVYAPGDVAIIYPSITPRNGALVIARLRDDLGGDVMLKLYQSANAQVTLSSINPAYPPMTWPRESFTWIYPVAQVTKNLLVG